MSISASSASGSGWKQFAIALLCIGVALGILFRKSFDAEQVLFSNDAPLGLIASKAGGAASTFQGIFTGYWQDNVWVGIEQPSILPGLSFGAYQLFRDPVVNAKFLAPLSLLFLGLSAWFCFRVFKFAPWVCVVGGLAAALNMNMLSHVAWGLASRAFTQGAILLAVAGVYSARGRLPWIKYALAGMCVGLAVVEGFDVGAIFSLYVAAFAFYLSMTEPGPGGKKFALGGARVATLALCAGLFSTQALITLINTQIKGVEDPGGKVESPQERWDSKTAWSLPKLETFRVLIPGLFGYRMDTEGGGNYWGSVGNPVFKRHSGAGEYAGVLVVLVAIFGAANAFRKKGNLYTEGEHKLAWFWTIAAVLSLLFAWGRHAPFFKIIYALPYFSTIRNPIKFMHAYHLAQWILFALGLQLMARHYLAATAAGGVKATFKRWWAGAAPFERKTVFGLAGGLVGSIVLFLIYYSSSGELHNYLVNSAGFNEGVSRAIAAFSYGEVGKYLIAYTVSLAAILLCLSGWLGGSRARFAPILLGAILFIDLGRAALPWIVHYNYKEKYANNEVFDFLKRNTSQSRVAYRITPFAHLTLFSQQFNFMESVLNEWHQNQFLYYDIPAIDVIQMARPPEMDLAYRQALMPLQQNFDVCGRLWQLTGTRYVFGQKEFLAELNARFDPAGQRFRIATNFDLTVKQGVAPDANVGLDDVEWVCKADGKFSIFEFTGALPRYALFTQWQPALNDTNSLQMLASPAFDPLRQLIVNEPQIAASTASTNAAPASSLRALNYNPKRAEFQTESAAPGIAVMNDKWSPNWKVRVDGQPAQLLRVNYIMRGVQVPAGSHKVEFSYEPPASGLYVSFGAMAAGALLCGFLAFDSRRARPAA